MENIIKLFTSEEQTEIKQAFQDILIENFRNEIETDTSWFFRTKDMADAIQEMMNELMHEIKDEFKGKLKKKLYEVLEKSNLS